MKYCFSNLKRITRDESVVHRSYNTLRCTNIVLHCLCSHWCRMPPLIRTTLIFLCPAQDVTQFVSDPISLLTNIRSCYCGSWKYNLSNSLRNISYVNMSRLRCIYINYKIGILGYVWLEYSMQYFYKFFVIPCLSTLFTLSSLSLLSPLLYLYLNIWLSKRYTVFAYTSFQLTPNWLYCTLHVVSMDYYVPSQKASLSDAENVTLVKLSISINW